MQPSIGSGLPLDQRHVMDGVMWSLLDRRPKGAIVGLAAVGERRRAR